MGHRTIRVLAIATTAALVSTAFGTITAEADVCWKYRERERKMLKKINGARGSRGIVKLDKDPQLSKVARRHSRRMADRKDVYHSGDLGNVVTKWNMLAENVGNAQNVKQMHKAFMDSSAHRYNILDSSFAHVGIGVVKAHGRIWVTEVFEAVANPGTTLKMPKC